MTVRTLAERCREIATRLLAGGPSLADLKQQARILDAGHLAEQIRRLEDSLERDPRLAIGTAKELVETCCKTILEARGKGIPGTPDIPTLTKATLKELKLVPEAVPNAARGADVIKRLLSNLSTVGQRSRRTARPLRHGARPAWLGVRPDGATRSARRRRGLDLGGVPVRDARGDQRNELTTALATQRATMRHKTCF